MAEVLFLGDDKIQSVADISSTKHAGELFLRFMNGSLERWLEEKKSINHTYITNLKRIPHEFSEQSVAMLCEAFKIINRPVIVCTQPEFDEALDGAQNRQIILLKGSYIVQKKISQNTEIDIIGEDIKNVHLLVGYSCRDNFESHCRCKKAEIQWKDFSDDDILAHIQFVIEKSGIGEKEKNEIEILFDSIPEDRMTQRAIREKMKFKRRTGDIDEAWKLAERLSDNEEKLFYQYEIKREMEGDSAELVKQYLEPAAKAGHMEAVLSYAVKKKNGTKNEKKEALDLLKKYHENNGTALNLLGDFYYEGIGQKADYKKACEMYGAALNILDSIDAERKHSHTGMGNALSALGNEDEAVKHYSMSGDIGALLRAVQYYKKKKDVKSVINHYKKCAEAGYTAALAELSEYLQKQTEKNYKDQALDFAMEYVRNPNGNSKRKKQLLERMYQYYDKEEPGNERPNCMRIEKEAVDNGIHISKRIPRIKKGAKRAADVAKSMYTVSFVLSGTVALGFKVAKSLRKDSK